MKDRKSKIEKGKGSWGWWRRGGREKEKK